MRLFLAIILIISSPVWARSEVEPDILVQSRFNRDWSSIFLNHMRAVMVSNGFGDPYKKTIEEPLIFDLGPQVSSLTPQSNDWYQALLKFLKIDLVKSDFKLIIEKFRYQVDNVDAAISPSTANGRMNWVMSHNVDGLGLGSDKISLEVQLYSTTGKPIVFSIQLVEPELIFNDMTLPVQAVWSSQILDESISVALTKLDLRDAMRGLQKNPNKVTMNIADVIVPPVEIRVGERSVRIDPAKLRNWILSRKDEMKKFILDVIVLKNIERFEDLTGEDDPTIPMERTFFAAGEKLSGAIRVDALIA
ncbi:MAG: hypothetical protein K2P81_11470, partial [Bacteriovoracaceae bacterium]|nr:hypothetical protein [Bacteriovoracaceae bacterium]